MSERRIRVSLENQRLELFDSDKVLRPIGFLPPRMGRANQSTVLRLRGGGTSSAQRLETVHPRAPSFELDVAPVRSTPTSSSERTTSGSPAVCW